jgi:hypothetical protein
VSGSPISEVKDIEIDLDRAIDDSSIEHLLSPNQLKLVKAERERRRRISGDNNSIING